MTKTILITGATDGIGLETAKKLTSLGHTVLLHGRSAQKLEAAKAATGCTEGYLADLSDLNAVDNLANEVLAKYTKIDALINNAGIFKTPNPITAKGQDIRFVVNTLAPYLLTQRLLPIIPKSGRVVNLSSAAQAPVDLNALMGKTQLADFDAYAQSKLAITMWTREMALTKPDGPMIVAVNPGSLLASKMVKEGFGMAGNDINIGVDILVRAALSEEFAESTGMYFDNDAGSFSEPHPDGLDRKKSGEVVKTIEAMLAD